MPRNIIKFGRDGKNSGIERKIGLSTSHICDISNPRSPRYDASFPKRIALSSRAVGFFEDEVDEWLELRRQCSAEREKKFQALQEGSKRFREEVQAGARLSPKRGATAEPAGSRSKPG